MITPTLCPTSAPLSLSLSSSLSLCEFLSFPFGVRNVEDFGDINGVMPHGGIWGWGSGGAGSRKFHIRFICVLYKLYSAFAGQAEGRQFRPGLPRAGDEQLPAEENHRGLKTEQKSP